MIGREVNTRINIAYYGCCTTHSCLVYITNTSTCNRTNTARLLSISLIKVEKVPLIITFIIFFNFGNLHKLAVTFVT